MGEIDGPKGNDVGDYVVNTRFGYFGGGLADTGLFFSFLGENITDPGEVAYLTRENGKYLQKPTYKILQDYNITELYFSGYGTFSVWRGIEEAQALGYPNI